MIIVFFYQMKTRGLALLLLVFVSAAHPWWEAGHKAIAAIAEQNLDSAITAKLNALLPPGESLVSLAARADEIRQHRQETKAWHYIDLPVRERVTSENLGTFCAKDGADIITQLNRETAALKDTNRPIEERRENLMFLVHFIGDLHMPLHCADDSDKGGNKKEVRYFKPGSVKGAKTNLHAVWDQMAAADANDPAAYGVVLDKKTSMKIKKAWRTGSIEDWALETYELAKNTVYKGLPSGPSETVIVLPTDYQNRTKPYVDEQIEKAGLRLAVVLASVLR